MYQSYAVSVVWTLAAYEAQFGQHSSIEPEHFLLAMLKFSEISDMELKNTIANGELQDDICAEQKKLITFFQQKGISFPETSEKIRQSLRGEMGKGDCADKNRKIIHRSLSTKEIFKKAEHSASATGSEKYTSVHLAREIFMNPTQKVRTILRRFDLKEMNQEISLEYLQKYGKVLNKSDHAQATRPGKFDPVFKVLKDSLIESPDRKILLISTGSQDICRLIDIFVENFNSSQEEVRLFIQVDVDQLISLHQSGSKREDPAFIINALFEEVSKNEEIILFFNHFEKWFDEQFSITLLEHWLKQKSIHCIAEIHEDGYSKLIKSRKPWNRLFHQVWIHENSPA